MLTTLERVKELLRIPQENTSQDLQLQATASAASELIESYCHRSFRLQSYTERRDGSGTPYLVLQNYPIKDVLTLLEHDQEVLPESFETLDDKGMLFRRGGWACGDLVYTVTYEAGYVLRTETEAGTLPEAIELAVAFLASQLLKQEQQSGVKSKRIGDISVTYDNEATSQSGAGQLPFVVRSLIDPYKGRVMV